MLAVGLDGLSLPELCPLSFLDEAGEQSPQEGTSLHPSSLGIQLLSHRGNRGTPRWRQDRSGAFSFRASSVLPHIGVGTPELFLE